MQTILKKPELYNLLYQDVKEDISLYKILLKSYDTIVEYGAGTGRITIPLAMEGKKIKAIDNEINMLENLHEQILKLNLEKQVQIINANMITYTQKELVDSVIMPLTVFNYIMDEKEQDECLFNVHKYLKVIKVMINISILKKLM